MAFCNSLLCIGLQMVCFRRIGAESFSLQQRPPALIAIGIGYEFAVPACGNPLCNRLD